MTNDPTSNPSPKTDGEVVEETKNIIQKKWRQIWNKLLLLGLGETTLHIITGVFAVVLILVVVWIMSSFFLKGQQNSTTTTDGTPDAQSTFVPSISGSVASSLKSDFSISRLAQIHTDFPSHPRDEITTYTVEKGDTIFGIADKFGLTPVTIILCNRYTLTGLPENLSPGTVLNIPPMDGVIYKWETGNGLNGVAEFYGVTPDVIIDWPGNDLDRATLGDLSLPNIPVGKSLFIPGGVAETIDYLPQVTRDTPAVATSYGEGYCGVITQGAFGSGTFIWPSTANYLSGYDWSSIHHGIDIAGDIGNAIFASDTGVVVYSGWNDNGYGYLIILDHGNGWQTVYAHLSEIYAYCGQSVNQGDIIAGMGSTGNSSGPHLHFEIRQNGGYVNPWNVLIR